MTSATFRNDPMFLRNQFEGDGVFELPVIRRESVALEEIALTGYDKLSSGETDQIVHFFLDDYKFESLWKDPESRIERLKRFRAVLSPDYSLYTEMPLGCSCSTPSGVAGAAHTCNRRGSALFQRFPGGSPPPSGSALTESRAGASWPYRPLESAAKNLFLCKVTQR